MNTVQSRSELFISPLQKELRNSRILIAGCGADGSHAADALGSLLVGTNATLVLADPDTYGPENLGIQQTTKGNLGVNKARATGFQIQDKYCGVNVEICEEGVTEDNCDELLQGVGYVVDATDISVIDTAEVMHRKATRNNSVVVVPWSLGLGGAVMVCTGPDQFRQWGEQSSDVARQYELGDFSFIARWICDVPQGISVKTIEEIISGERPTPTTFLGAVAGGHMAARIIMAHASGLSVPVFPHMIVARSSLLKVNYEEGHFIDFVRTAFEYLKTRQEN